MNQSDNLVILVAEDEQYNYLYAAELLKSINAEVVHARNGQEAIDACISNSKIDLVLMDIKMPVKDGLEATRAIKSMRIDLPVIAVTAYALSGEKEKFMEAGFDKYLSKPIRKADLLDAIREHSPRLHLG